MKIRAKEFGDKNIIGAKVEKIRKENGMKQKELLVQLQVRGIDISASALSKLEGQVRIATDIELLAISNILNVPVETLLGEWFLNKYFIL